MHALAPWLRTEASSVWTLHRVALATVVFPFGAQTFVNAAAAPGVQVLAIVCTALLAFGLLTRVAATFVGVLFVAMLATGQALALPLLGLALCLGLVARGGGVFSIDRVIARAWDSLQLEPETTDDPFVVGRRVGEIGR